MAARRRLPEEWDAITLWLPVVCVAAATQAKLGLEEPWTGSDAGLTASSLLLAAPLVARRRWPVAAATAVAGALPVQVALGGSLSFGSFVAVLVIAYSVGRRVGTRIAAGAVAVILVGLVVATRHDLPAGAAELVFPLFYVSAAASIGVVVKRLSEQASELRALNAALARERDATTRLAVAAERIRLSRDLHDSIAHTLTVAVVQAEKCEQAIPDDLASASAAAAAVQDAGRRGLSELRSTLRVLRDPADPLGDPGLADVAALVSVVSGSGLEVTVATHGDIGRVPEDVGRQMFRVVQESLTNVIRHSAAATATVTVSVDADEVALVVADPGPALSSGLSSGGNGTRVMAERLAALGGRLTAAPEGSGYRVQASAPLAAEVDR